MSEFELDSRLATDSVLVAEGPLSQVRLMNDERFPWLVLVPRLAGVTEWIELDGEQQDKLRTELNRACKALKGADGWKRSTSGAGQHRAPRYVIGRHDGDPAWPGRWGSGPRTATSRPRWTSVAYWKERLDIRPSHLALPTRCDSTSLPPSC
jgi:diadenosine tetraphosphate (Ap4A) HIT family hydrolase